MSDSVDELKIAMGVEQLVNLAQVTVYPVETVGTLSVIWTARSVMRVAPGETRVIYALYGDENGERCGALDVAEPVPFTDYLVDENRDGVGNYTGTEWFTMGFEAEATRAKVTMTNTATGALYVTFFQIRGKPIRTYDPVVIEVEDETSQAAYQVQAVTLDLPMVADDVFAQAYGEYLVGRFKTPTLDAVSVTVKNRAVFGDVNVLGLELMDKVAVTDAQTGLAAAEHWIRAVEYEIGGGGVWSATFHLERADDRQYWLLEREGYGELGSTTRLGF
jgi:hypothetical protein